MVLKKSDKIIAIVGVIILIVAAVGVFLYVDTGDEGKGNGMGDMIKEYQVTWVPYPDSMTITGWAGKKTVYTEPIVIEGVIENGCVLTTVTINVTWNDDFTKGLLIRKGEDHLTATFTLSGGESQTHESTKGHDGSDKMTFTINEAPFDEMITDVEDLSDARNKIETQYSGKNTAYFDVNVEVKTGEKLLTLRPLKFLNYLRDKGNGFTITVTYDYYKPEIVETGGNDNINDNDGTETGYNGNTYEYLKNASHGRDV